nr:unnamed protein product [Thermoproteus tenax virus 1]
MYTQGSYALLSYFQKNMNNKLFSLCNFDGTNLYNCINIYSTTGILHYLHHSLLEEQYVEII